MSEEVQQTAIPYARFKAERETKQRHRRDLDSALIANGALRQTVNKVWEALADLVEHNESMVMDETVKPFPELIRAREVLRDTEAHLPTE